MVDTATLISPKQVALALGVSESSLKRWCDQGRIKTTRTAGGHRRIAPADVLNFVRENDHSVVHRELLGLPPASIRKVATVSEGETRLTEALLRGDEKAARRIFFDLYLGKTALYEIFDQVIAGAFDEIGNRWACDEAEIYQERRSCEICMQLLHQLRRWLPSPTTNLVAIGGTLPGDNYSIPTLMAELILRNQGFSATSFGNSIPAVSFVAAIQKMRPKLVWISVSHMNDVESCLQEINCISKCCIDNDAALVVGGKTLVGEFRKRVNYTAFCDTMQHLVSFARTIAANNSNSTNERNKSIEQKRKEK